MDLDVFLEPKVDLPRIAKILDDLGPMGRRETIRGWERDTMRALYDAAKGYKKLGVEDFVPSGVAPITEVIHEGMNSLAAFNRFEKRFARSSPEDGDPIMFGYNHQDMSFWTGPGYFVVHPWETAGEVAIDYRELPPATLATWPPVISNTARLGRFVYAGMVDIMRGISRNVSIGRTQRNGKWMDTWFVLSRIDS